MKWILLGYIVAQALDMATTARNVSRGCQELVWPNAQTAYVVKSAGIGLTLNLSRQHRDAAKTIAVIGIGGGIAGVAFNLSQSCR